MISCCVNVGLSLWEGVVDRRIPHSKTKLTCHSRASARLEQGTHRRSEATMETQTRLGDPGAA